MNSVMPRLSTYICLSRVSDFQIYESAYNYSSLILYITDVNFQEILSHCVLTKLKTSAGKKIRFVDQKLRLCTYESDVQRK